MLGTKSVISIFLVFLVISGLLAFLLWVQTSRLETKSSELSKLEVANNTLQLTVSTMTKDYQDTLALNQSLQSKLSLINKELAERNQQIQYYRGKVDVLAKTNPELAESNINGKFTELMQSISETTGHSKNK